MPPSTVLTFKTVTTARLNGLQAVIFTVMTSPNFLVLAKHVASIAPTTLPALTSLGLATIAI